MIFNVPSYSVNLGEGSQSNDLDGAQGTSVGALSLVAGADVPEVQIMDYHRG